MMKLHEREAGMKRFMVLMEDEKVEGGVMDQNGEGL